MVLRVTRGQFEPALYTEVERIIQEMASILSGLPGVRGFQAGVDQTAGTVLTIITLDKADQAQFSREVFGDILARLQALSIQIEPTEVYEVVKT